MGLEYWDHFYDSQGLKRVPDDPSAFALHAAGLMPRERPIIDLGTGTGRDAIYFAEHGFRVHGLDFSSPAIDRLKRIATHRGLAAEFEVLDVSNMRDIKTLIAELSRKEAHTLYARFFLHAIPDGARRNFWLLASAVARAGGDCWLEFRVSDDLQPTHEFGDHFRCPLTVEGVMREAQANGLFVHSCEAGHGMAVYRSEDPLVARLILSGAPLQKSQITTEERRTHSAPR